MLETKSLVKNYVNGEREISVLRSVSISIQAGEFLAMMGPSGSGKSTFLHLVGGLDSPTSGEVRINGQSLGSFNDRELSEFRRKKLGFVFQFFNLLSSLNAIENVALPLLLDGVKKKEARARAEAALEQVGLKNRLDHRPDRLSGGEMQRIAIARALVSDPLLILADEPTGNLDSTTGKSILEILRSIARDHRKTLVMVTHDAHAATYANRIVTLRDGQIESDRPVV